MGIRYARARDGAEYVLPLMSGRHDGAVSAELWPSWNVAPGTRQPAIGRMGAVRRLRWGWPSPGAAAQRLRTIVATSVFEAASPAWRALRSSGRVIVPADGWFEWLPAADGRQPYFIRRLDGEPLFMAAFVVAPRGVGDVYGASGVERDCFMIVAAPLPADGVDRHAR